MEIIKNDLYTFGNPKKITKYVQKKAYTLVLTGSPRSGTSILGYTFRALGYDLGVEGSRFHEDLNFLPEKWNDIEFIKNHIKQRNKNNKIWGFKSPFAVLKVDFLCRTLRNPIFICIYRNILQTVNSLINRDKNFFPKSDTAERYERAMEFVCTYYQSSKNLFRYSAPFLLLEYEEIKENPQAYLDLIIRTFNIKSTHDKCATIIEKITKPGYKYL